MVLWYMLTSAVYKTPRWPLMSALWGLERRRFRYRRITLVRKSCLGIMLNKMCWSCQPHIALCVISTIVGTIPSTRPRELKCVRIVRKHDVELYQTSFSGGSADFQLPDFLLSKVFETLMFAKSCTATMLIPLFLILYELKYIVCMY